MDWKLVGAFGVAISLGLWGLSELLPAVVFSGRLLVTSSAEAAKLGVSVSPFFVVVAEIGIGALGLSAAAMAGSRAVTEARKDPYSWILPALTAAGTLLVDISLEGTQIAGFTKILYLLVTAVCLFAGGVAMEKRRFWFMAAGIVLCSVPPLTVIFIQLASMKETEIAAALASVSPLSWLWFGVLCTVSGITIKLAR